MTWRYIPALAAAVWVVVELMRRYRARQKRILSADWPMVAANFLSGAINTLRTVSAEMGEATTFRLRVDFSYHAKDSERRGEYTHDFRIEQEAIDLLRSLKQGPFYIRYDPASPSEYVVDPYRDVWVPQRPK